MKLIDADAMNEELFYKQVGGKDSLITAESAFKMIDAQPIAYDVEAVVEQLEELKSYKDLEEQGLLLKLPCKEVYSKSGDEVYFIFEDEIIECIHCGLDICGSDGEGYIILGAYEDIFPYRDPDPEYDLDPTDWCRNTNHVSLSEIGKTLFFTREEAEKKLEEIRNV